MQKATKKQNNLFINLLINKKNWFPLIATCVIVPLIFWIFVFQLDTNISANAYLTSAPICLIGLVYPTFFYPFALVYILKSNNIKTNWGGQSDIWRYIGQLLLFSFVVTFVGSLCELLLMLIISFIPTFDSNHYLTAAFRWIFSSHTTLISQTLTVGYVFFTLFMFLFSYISLLCIHLFIALLLTRFVKDPIHVVFWLFIITSFNFVFSDAILMPDIFAHLKIVTGFSYLCPTRYAMWSYFFSLSGNSSAYFVFDDYEAHAKAFHSIAVSLPLSLLWALFFGSIYLFSISDVYKKLWKVKK